MSGEGRLKSQADTFVAQLILPCSFHCKVAKAIAAELVCNFFSLQNMWETEDFELDCPNPPKTHCKPPNSRTPNPTINHQNVFQKIAPMLLPIPAMT